MFHWNIFVTYDASKFVLTVPMHYMAVLVSLPAALIFLTFGLKTGSHLRNCFVLLALLTFFGISTYSSETTLDKKKGTATVREFEFYHWSTHTFNLSHVDRFYEAGSSTSALRMQFVGGATYTLTLNDDQGGKEEAAYAANSFIESAATASE